MAVTAYQMIEAHPNQQMYFNRLAGPNVTVTSELDYWDLNLRQGLEYVAAHNSRVYIKVTASISVTPVAQFNPYMPPTIDR